MNKEIPLNKPEKPTTPPAFDASKANEATSPVPPAFEGKGAKVPKANQPKKQAGAKTAAQPSAPIPEKGKGGSVKKVVLWALGIFVGLAIIGSVLSDDEASSSSQNGGEAASEQVAGQKQGDATKSGLMASDKSESSAVATRTDTTKKAVLPGVGGREPYKGDVRQLPKPDSIVNDFACILKEDSIKRMTDSLQTLAKKTGTQVTVVTVMDLCGEDPTMFASEIGDKWGVGEKGKDNGVVILFKAKTAESKGQVAIAPGRGLEGVLPDAFCKDIIADKMIPELQEGNDYTAATWAALKIILPVCRGEYSEEQYNKDKEDEDSIGWFGWLCLILVFGPILILLVDTIFLHDKLSKKMGIYSPTKGNNGRDGTWTSGTGGFGSSSSGWGSSSGSSGWSSGSWGGGSFSGGGASGSW